MIQVHRRRRRTSTVTNRDHPGESQAQPIHAQLLETALRLCNRDDWTFRLHDVVGALPHLNAKSVYADASRCCVNAPRHHAKHWDYFRRARSGVYEILPRFRPGASDSIPLHGERLPQPRRDTAAAREADHAIGQSAIHAVIRDSEGWYVAECLETAVVTQGRTLDEPLANLRSALELHLDDEELALAGLPSSPRLVLSYETSSLVS